MVGLVLPVLSNTLQMNEITQPQFPIYIPSKSRAINGSTARILDSINVPYRLVVEEQQYAEYADYFPKEKLLILDKKYQDNYETFDDLGNTKSKGPGPARNFIWEHSISEGHDWHWVRNELSYRWRGRYNEDTDLSLVMLKAGWATVQFNAFLQNKAPTQTFAGGNTEAFYAGEGTKPKSQMLVDMHPDVARLVWRFNRWHHHVDYLPFKKLGLIRKPNYEELINTSYKMKRTERENLKISPKTNYPKKQ